MRYKLFKWIYAALKFVTILVLLFLQYFKLFSSVFRKCLENIRLRLNFHLVNTPERLRKYVSKTSFERFQIFNEDLIGVVNKQVNLVLNKPIYIGQAILDLSKKWCTTSTTIWWNLCMETKSIYYLLIQVSLFLQS